MSGQDYVRLEDICSVLNGNTASKPSEVMARRLIGDEDHSTIKPEGRSIRNAKGTLIL